MADAAPPAKVAGADVATTATADATAAAAGDDGPVRWKALESNPDILNDLVRSLGVPDPFAFHEVLGLEPDLLAMLPQPVLAFIVLYPPHTVAATDAAAAAATAAAAGTPSAGEKPSAAPSTPAVPAGEVKAASGEAKKPAQALPFFMTQVAALTNACGTVAALHAMANLNLAGVMPIAPTTALGRWIKAASSLTPDERGELLDASAEIEEAHSKLAAEGQSATLSDEQEEQVELHFACFIALNGRLIELDGVKDGPLDHGAIAVPGDATPEDAARAFMNATAAYVRSDIIAKLNGDVRVSIIAFCGATED